MTAAMISADRYQARTVVDGLRAAVGYWPDRAAAVVLANRSGDCTTYSPRLQRCGVTLPWGGPNAVVGRLLLPPPETPPAGRLMAMCRAQGFGDWVWELSRKWRIWRHDR